MPRDKKTSGLRNLWKIATIIPLRRSVLVLSCLIVSGLAEGVGVASLLPLITVLGDQAGEPNAVSRAVFEALSALGIPAEPLVLLSALAGGMLLKAGLMLLALRHVGYAVAEVGMRMRLDLIEALMGARWSFYVHQPTGRYANALEAGAKGAGDAYNFLAMFLAGCIQATVYFLVAAVASWQVALAAMAVSLIMVGSLNRLLISAKRSARIQTRHMNTMLARLTDVLIGLKPMKAMGRHARFSDLLLRDAEDIKLALRRQVFSRNTNRALQEPILAICLAIGIYIAITYLMMPVGELLVMSILLAKTVQTVGKAQQNLQMVYTAESGYELVADAIQDARNAREHSRGAGRPTLNDTLEAQGLCFAFKDRPIVTEATFTLRPGELTALIGPSGTGKTTLVDIVLGFYAPDAGNVFVDGRPLSEIDLAQWRRMVGYIPQEVFLFHDTVRANITLGEEAFSREDVEQALRLAGAWDFVDGMPDGLDTVVGERGGLLSGGQRQRIAIARALVQRPRLLILDEATSALDPGMEAQVVQAVRDLAERTGMVVLSISHNAKWGEVAHQVLRLEGGHLTSERPPSPADGADRRTVS